MDLPQVSHLVSLNRYLNDELVSGKYPVNPVALLIMIIIYYGSWHIFFIVGMNHRTMFSFTTY